MVSIYRIWKPKIMFNKRNIRKPLFNSHNLITEKQIRVKTLKPRKIPHLHEKNNGTTETMNYNKSKRNHA